MRPLLWLTVVVTAQLGFGLQAGDELTRPALEPRLTAIIQQFAQDGFRERRQAAKDLAALVTRADLEVRQALAKPLDAKAREAAAPVLAAGRYLAERLEAEYGRQGADPEVRAGIEKALGQPHLPAAFYTLAPREQAIVLAPFTVNLAVGATTTDARIHAAGVAAAVLDLGDVRLVRADLKVDQELTISQVRLSSNDDGYSHSRNSGDPATTFESSGQDGQCSVKWAGLTFPITAGSLTFDRKQATFGRGPTVIFVTPDGTADKIIRLRLP